MERLDKIISATGKKSRREVKLLVKQGRILVDGVPASAPEMKVDPAVSEILLDGENIGYQRFTYIMLLSAYSIFVIALGLNLPFGYFFAPADDTTISRFTLNELGKLALGQLARNRPPTDIAGNFGGALFTATELFCDLLGHPKSYRRSARKSGRLHADRIEKPGRIRRLADNKVAYCSLVRAKSRKLVNDLAERKIRPRASCALFDFI